MPFIPPGSIPQVHPPMVHQLSQNVLPNPTYNEIQMHLQPQETNRSLPGNSTSHNKLFQDNIYQNQSELNSVLLSEQQEKANANLELANRLSARRNIIPGDVPLVDPTLQTCFSPSFDEFPRLK